MTDQPSDEDTWFAEEARKAPMKQLRDHMVVGHGRRSGKPVVIVALEVENEPVVYCMHPDRADHMAKLLRRSAGAVRALQEQEDTE